MFAGYDLSMFSGSKSFAGPSSSSTPTLQHHLRQGQLQMPTQQFAVKWGKSERFQMSFDLSCTPLSILQSTLSHLTGVSGASMKLLHSGTWMRDPKATLASYGIHAGSNILLMAPQRIKDFDSAETTTKDTVVSTIDSVMSAQQVMDNISLLASLHKNDDDLLQEYLKLELAPHGKLPPVPAKPYEKDDVMYQYRLMSEFFLRVLISLDSVDMQLENANDELTAVRRSRRKLAVRQVQLILTHLDKLKTLHPTN